MSAADIVAENKLSGTPESQWDVIGAGDPSIQGFTTDISYDVGHSVQFKISTDSTHYRLDIYRMGYYQGDGARLITSIDEQLSQPKVQPDPITDPATQANDFGDWSVSATWNIPTTAVSGVYFAKLVREDNVDPGGASHVMFIVRNDASHSDILMQASVTTWEAYNTYGGNSFYSPSLDQRAFAASFNRPFNTRGGSWMSWVFSDEYPTIRFLESNGYDVSYTTDVDTDRYGSLIKNHKIFLSVGHDEYWSAQQRANVESARNAGVNLAFFSGNEVFWKTRWEDSFDGSNTSYRTLVCYKETLDGTPTDPADPPIWTGTWRDPRFSPPADGGRPENALTGTLFMVNSYRSDSIQVPQSDGLLRFWRNTSIATMLQGQVATLPAGILGYEWDVDADNGFRPAGEFDLSHTTISLSAEYLLDYGGTFGAGTATHSLAEYRAASGALVFGAGTINWAWGLDSFHDDYNGYRDHGTADVRIQQATVNLFADMGAQPGSLVGGLIPASASTDHTPPTSHITSVAPGFAFVQTGATYTISGTAVDSGGGVVAGVEVSTDGGTTWHPAVGRQSWTYLWTPGTTGTATILSRAVDDSGNLETPSAGVSMTVNNGAVTPPQIINATALVTSTQSVSFSWTTDKASTSMVEYGTSPTALNQTASSSTAVTSHALTLTNLTPDTTYYYRLGSTDSFSNTAWSPAVANPPASASTPAFIDTTAADFGAGTTSGTYISRMSNGEVILSPTAAADFTGTSLPPGWAVLSTSGGSATVSNGLLTVSGAHVGTSNTYAPGSSLDFEGNFDGAASEHIGFGVDFVNAPWAIFSTGRNGGALYARASGAPDVQLSGNWLSAMHHFRIDWEPSKIVYSIDGIVVATEAASLGTPMRPLIASDTTGGTVQVEWMHMSPYSSNGTYVSRVFDPGKPVVWSTVTADTATPAGTTVAIDVRMGTTASPDSTWTDFIPLASLGAVIGGTSRYLQYRADLSTTDSSQTPVLSDVAITYTLPPDTVAPRIAFRTPPPGAAGVAIGTSITVEFSELMNASTINASTVYLRPSGSGANVPATVSYAGSTATLTPSAPLNYNTTYSVTVLGSIADSSGNPLGSAVTWSFTTILYSYFTDTAAGDFAAGTLDPNGYISQSGNGEVMLVPTAGTEFSGSSLSAGWAVLSTQSGGTISLNNGLLTIHSALVGTNASYGPGRSLEFEANFDGTKYQHVGFGVDFTNAPWAIFSTGASGGALYARASGMPDILIPGNDLGVMHDYRIDWNAGSIVYWIDGVQVATQNLTIAASMRPLIAEQGGGTLMVDWMRMTPYAASSTFVSHIFDGGQSVTWGPVSWDDTIPAGTAVAISVRMGNTATPDASWTGWLPMASSGSVVGGSSRYFQYQAILSTSNVGQTPALDDLTLAYNTLPDTTAPTVVSHVPASAAASVDVHAAVSIGFSKLMNAATINSSTVYLRANGSNTNVAATVNSSGSMATLVPSAPLAYNTMYTVTVLGSVADASGNPLASAVTWSFTTILYSYLADTTASDFAAGMLDANGYVSQTGNGEVMLAPAAGTEFFGSSLSSGWAVLSTQSGGTATLAGGLLTVHSAHVGTSDLYGPGRSMEIAANFDGTKYQHVGFGVDFTNAPWAIFSTGANGGALYARASGMPDILLSGNYLDAMHHYRIDWNASSIVYWIDGVQVATQNVAITSNMRPLTADDGGGTLTVDWIRMTPYAASSTFVSRVFDGGQTVTWGPVSWDDSVPASTAVAVSLRMGNTATPDGSWTGWVPVASSGATVGGSSRYFQYQAILSTTNVGQAPALDDLTVAYNTLPDTTPPTIASRVPASGATGVDIHAAISIEFSKLMDPSTISTSTIYLQASGSSTIVPTTVSYSGSTATLTPSAPLAYNTTYNVTVLGTVSDTSGNTLGSSTTWSFTTVQYSYLTDTTAADFAAGSLDANGYISQTGNGEVMLAPTAGTEFSGSSLPTGWAVLSTFSGGSATLAGGLLTVDNAHVGTNAVNGPGRSLEFEANFGGTKEQHVGFGVDYVNTPWAIFSTGANGGALYARASGMPDILLSGSYLGAMHHYRIDWNVGSIVYWIDGVQVATQSVAITTSMRPLIADEGGGTVVLDWMRLTPYAATSTFVSRVFDGGQTVNWGPVSWDDSTPAGTSIVISVRMGNTATPDGSWTGWTTIASSGTVVGGSSRYVQYRAVLSTTDTSQTPALDDLTLGYND